MPPMQEPPDYQPNWYATSFDRDYERIYRGTDDVAAKEVRAVLEYLGLPGSKRQPADVAILDLGCGWGRHSILLANAGYRVTGVDLSQAMIDEAAQRTVDAGLEIATGDALLPRKQTLPDVPQPRGLRLVRGDMRNLP